MKLFFFGVATGMHDCNRGFVRGIPGISFWGIMSICRVGLPGFWEIRHFPSLKEEKIKKPFKGAFRLEYGRSGGIPK